MKNTLYCSRSVENFEDIISWAKSQNIPNIIPANEFHVTVAYSKSMVDHDDIDPKNNMVYLPPRKRKLAKFGSCIVLLLTSTYLDERWEYYIKKGCSWDFDTYNPHITISYEGGDFDINNIKAYSGEIILNEEIIDIIDDTYVEKLD